MPSSNQLPIGGLSGGLYQLFNAVGFTFFTFLLGSSRARHSSLKGSRVGVGGFLTLGISAALTSSFWLPADLPTALRVFMGLGAGGFLGLLVGGILLSYVSSVDEAIRKEERRQVLFEEKYSELIKRKVSPVEAHNQATAYANQKTSGCFIATAAYGSSSASEVELLRSWRDEVLLQTYYGRLFVDWYYRISPTIAALIRPHQRARKLARLLLSPIVVWVSRTERCRRGV